MKTLQEFRKEIDQIDADICKLIARRFAITHQVGIYKLKNNLQPQDKKREMEIMEELGKKAQKLKINPVMLQKIFKIIIAKTKKNHSLCHSRENGNPGSGSRINSGMTN
jgi:chorismate mutase